MTSQLVQFPISPKYQMWINIAKQLNHEWSYECREALIAMAISSGCTPRQLAKLRQELS